MDEYNYLFITVDGGQRLIQGVSTFKDALKSAARWFDQVDELFFMAVDGVDEKDPETMVRMYNKFSDWPISQAWNINSKIY